MICMSVFQSTIDTFRKDEFGVLLFSLMYVAALIAKWIYIDPAKPGYASCVICAMAVLWLLAIFLTLILTALWILWDTKAANGVKFIFVLGVGAVCCAVFMNYLSQKVFAKLYYSGLLNWQESHVNYLFDDFLKHSSGLYLATLVLYSMIRIAMSRQFNNRKAVVAFSLYFSMVSSALLFLGLKLY